MCGLESARFLIDVTTTIGPRSRKALGQHFLNDGRVIGRIVAAAELVPQDVVMEVGPGRGALTRLLTQRAGRVIAVERDSQLAAGLPGRLSFPTNLVTVEADARSLDIPSLLGQNSDYKLVANLPYYAANPILRRFLESEHQPSLAVVMVQREVAESMAALPGAMSMLSVAVQFYARPSLVCHVPPTAFRPPPKVASTVVRLDVRQSPPVEVEDPQDFFDFVRAGFSAPRKQLRNSLGLGLGVPGAEIGEMLSSVEFDGRRRAETLALSEWGLIYHKWNALQSGIAIGG